MSKWKDRYDLAKKYYEKHGNLLIPGNYTENSIRLGSWIKTQRVAYKKKQLSKDRVTLLDEIDMIWEIQKGTLKNGVQILWEDKYQLAKEYYKEHGNLLVPMDYQTAGGIKLGIWIANQRQIYAGKVKNASPLSQEQIDKLESIGMVWSLKSYQTSFPEQTIFYYLAQIFTDNIENRYTDLGFEIDIYIPSLKLGIEYDGQGFHNDNKRINNDKKKNELCEKNNINLIRVREPNLDELDKSCVVYKIAKIGNNQAIKDSIIWIVDYINENYNTNYSVDINIERDTIEILKQYKLYSDRIWEKKYKLAEDFYKKHGNLLITDNYVVNGVKLGKWIRTQRSSRKGRNTAKITKEQIAKLNKIGMFWSIDEISEYKWNKAYEEAKKYFDRHGNLDVPDKFISNEINLSSWLEIQRTAYRDNKLSKKQIDKLNKLNMRWVTLFAYNWEYNYNLAKEYYDKHGNLLMPKEYKTESGEPLGYWVSTQRMAYNGHGKWVITQEQIDKLNLIGMEWVGLKEGRPKFFFGLLKDYIENTENPFPIHKNFIYNNEKLGNWLRIQAANYKTNKLKPEHLEEFKKLGVDLSSNSLFAKTSGSDGCQSEGKLSVSDEKWLRTFNGFKDLVEKKEIVFPLDKHPVYEDVDLYKWLWLQLNKYQNDNLKPLYVSKLKELLDLDSKLILTLPEIKWNENFDLLKDYMESTSNPFPISPNFVYKDKPLGDWLQLQFKYSKTGYLREEYIERFKEIKLDLDSNILTK